MKPTQRQLSAAERLWAVANRHSGQSIIVANFLLSLYNGYRFRFNLTDFRVIDTDIFIDCIDVLIMDSSPQREIHEVLNVPSVKFEELAKRHGIAEID